MPNPEQQSGSVRLMTVSEIAEEYDVSRQTVHGYRRRGTFPQPVQGEGSTRPRFRADEVAVWFAANPKRPGRRTDLAPQQPGEDVDELIAFYSAQLDKDEAAARAACWDEQSDVWTARPPQARYEQYTVVDYLDDGVVVAAPENADADGVGQHIARHDPARVLREVEAGRRLIRAHEKWCEGRCEAKYPNVGPDAAYYWEIKNRAAVYADHPDYREKWRP
ncbi:DUF6221 family protein [Streptomyces nanhaiensis]|uniref:DUF6221 family protein n=1 Tax=Streptomyces nanhaiensis TaxID=679319 RepID=UPI00399CDBC5